jgi:hypothetical protein
MRIADFIEEAFQDQVVLRRQGAQGGVSGAEVLRQLVRCGQGQSIVLCQLRARLIQPAGRKGCLDLGVQTGDRLGQGVAAPGCLTQPERHARWRCACVRDVDLSGFHPQDAIGAIAQLDDISGQTFEGEILVQRADAQAFWLQYHVVIEQVGYGAAVEQRAQASASPGSQPSGDGIVEQVGAAPSVPRADAFREQGQHLLEVAPCQRPIGPGCGDLPPQVGLADLAARGDFGHDLLGEHVQRTGRHPDLVQRAGLHRIQQRGALHQIVPAQGKQPSFGRASDAMAGAAHSLQQGIDRPWRADLADQVHLADVDPQFERGGRHQHPQRAGLQPGFGIQAMLPGQAAMMGADCFPAEPIGELPGQPFAQPARVDEDQRGAMGPYPFG